MDDAHSRLDDPVPQDDLPDSAGEKQIGRADAGLSGYPCLLECPLKGTVREWRAWRSPCTMLVSAPVMLGNSVSSNMGSLRR